MNDRAITIKALKQLQNQTGLVGQVNGYAPASAGCDNAEALIVFDNCSAKLLAQVCDSSSYKGVSKPGINDVLVEAASGFEKLLICDYVSQEDGARLRDAKLNYLDNVGNAYLDITPIYVLIQGNKPKDDFAFDRAAKLYTETGLKVILALLANRDLLNASYRRIADHANVSMGTIGWVLRELKGQGFVLAKNGRSEWLDRDRLIKKWVEEYPTLKEKYLHGIYYVKDQNSWQSIELEKYQAVLGGEIAAVEYSSGFAPRSGEIFIGKHKQNRLIQDLRLREMAQPKGDYRTRVEVMAKFWGHTQKSNLFDNLTHPLISYASLMDSWDPERRGLAEKVAKQFL